MEKSLLEGMNLKVDHAANATAGITGSRVSMANATRLHVVVLLASATTATANTVLLKQHDAASSGNSKAVEVTNPYFHKIDAATSFTKVDVETAEDTFNIHALVGDDTAVFAIDILAEEMDRDNDYNYLSVDLGAAGVTRNATILYFVDGSFDPAYSGAL